MLGPFSKLTLSNTPLTADIQSRDSLQLDQSKKGSLRNSKDACCLRKGEKAKLPMISGHKHNPSRILIRKSDAGVLQDHNLLFLKNILSVIEVGFSIRGDKIDNKGKIGNKS